MPRPVSRTWLALWAALVLSPLLLASEGRAAGATPSLSEYQGSPLLSRAPAVSRIIPFPDHGAGAGTTALPSVFRAGLTPLAAGSTLSLSTEPRAIGSAVLPDNYPTGPPAQR